MLPDVSASKNHTDKLSHHALFSYHLTLAIHLYLCVINGIQICTIPGLWSTRVDKQLPCMGSCDLGSQFLSVHMQCLPITYNGEQ